MNKFIMKKILLIIPFLLSIMFLSNCSNLKEECVHIFAPDSTIEATCEAEGIKIEKCIFCKEERKTYTKALGHEYQLVELNATCTEKGGSFHQCIRCNQLVELDPNPALGHEYIVNVIDPTCETEGYTITTCNRCNYYHESDLIDPVGHEYSEWQIIKEATELSDGLQQRTCIRCYETETLYIASTAYVDLTILKTAFDSAITYEINSYEELSIKFQTAIINLSETLICKINYELDNFDGLLKELVEDCDLGFDFQVGARLANNVLTFSFTHQPEPVQSTNNICYSQYASANYQSSIQTRLDDFNQFKINNSLYSFEVKTSDQLWYVLEHGVYPICVAGSRAERAYNELKKILIKIIDDQMTDYEKVKTIHDYLIMNVTYDHDLYDLLYTDPDNLKSYNGFYLEGVLFDQLAVCEGISKAFTALCNIEGIPCVSVSGYQTSNPNGAGHAWNKVYIDGNWYIVDVTSDGTIVNSQFEILSYQYFLIDEAKYRQKYTGTNYLNITCDDDYNPYEHSSFVYNSNIYDFVITSQAELNSLIGYFNSIEQTNISIEFKLAFDYGDSITDELTKAYQANHLSKGYSYIDSWEIIILIK